MTGRTCRLRALEGGAGWTIAGCFCRPTSEHSPVQRRSRGRVARIGQLRVPETSAAADVEGVDRVEASPSSTDGSAVGSLGWSMESMVRGIVELGGANGPVSSAYSIVDRGDIQDWLVRQGFVRSDGNEPDDRGNRQHAVPVQNEQHVVPRVGHRACGAQIAPFLGIRIEKARSDPLPRHATSPVGRTSRRGFSGRSLSALSGSNSQPPSGSQISTLGVIPPSSRPREDEHAPSVSMMADGYPRPKTMSATSVTRGGLAPSAGRPRRGIRADRACF